MSDSYWPPPTTDQTASEQNFPPKPVIPETPFLLTSLLSLAAFVGVYYLFFDQSVFQIAILVLVLFIHELGHFLAMKIFGYSDVKMFFIPFLGALVTGNKEEISQKQRAIILLAGPVPGIIIGAMLYYVGKDVGNKDILLTAAMFIVLNAINLLPLNPLDGGRLIETLFFHSKDMIRNIFLWASAGVMAILAIRFEMYSLLILPFALMMTINQGKITRAIKDSLHAKGLDYSKSFNTWTDREYWLIRETVLEQHPAFRKIDGRVYEESPRERQIANTLKNLVERKIIPDAGAGMIALFTLIWLVFLVVPTVLMVLAYYRRI